MEGGECNSLDFQLGTTGIDATLPTNRGWNIKVLALLNLFGIFNALILISHYTLSYDILCFHRSHRLIAILN